MMKLFCIICTDEISANSTASATHCGHIFHQDCLAQWQSQCCKLTFTCPQCRSKEYIRSVVNKLYFETGSGSWDNVDALSNKVLELEAQLAMTVSECDANIKELTTKLVVQEKEFKTTSDQWKQCETKLEEEMKKKNCSLNVFKEELTRSKQKSLRKSLENELVILKFICNTVRKEEPSKLEEDSIITQLFNKVKDMYDDDAVEKRQLQENCHSLDSLFNLVGKFVRELGEIFGMKPIGANTSSKANFKKNKVLNGDSSLDMKRTNVGRYLVHKMRINAKEETESSPTTARRSKRLQKLKIKAFLDNVHTI